MKFDTVTIAPCASNLMDEPCPSEAQSDSRCDDPNYRVLHPECDEPDDCADPVFAAANPALCLSAARLILKPDSATVEPRKTIQFKTYLWQDGQETLIDSGVVYRLANPTIALIGASSGAATGMIAGVTTVSAEYAGMYAYAQLEVVNNCTGVANAFALILDVSKSMKNSFSGLYATRYSMAEKAATSFVNCIDFDKDTACVFAFDTDCVRWQGLTATKSEITDAIDNIGPKNNSTNIANALQEADNYFEEQAVSEFSRVFVIFTDGENKTGENPVVLAKSLQERGSIVIVFALRAHGTNFNQLEHIASGGFLINATPANEANAVDWLNGLKSHICSGNCYPTGGIVAAQGALNYTAFKKWTVTDGVVDLCGSSAVTDFWDIIPGHGMYVDMCGTHASGSTDTMGTLQSKQTFPVTAGKTYHLHVNLAGNNRQERTEADVMRLAVLIGGAIEAESFIDKVWNDDFAESTLTFTASATGNATLIIQQYELHPTDDFGYNLGCLVDDVIFENVTDGEIILQDNFDYENQVYVPPECSHSDTFYTPDFGAYSNYPDCTADGVNCIYSDSYHLVVYSTDCSNACGCAETPIEGQTPDPLPLPELEVALGDTPTLYTATRSYTATCAAGLTGSDVTKIAVATSAVSQADADAKALALATSLANAAIQCVAPLSVGDIVNVRFWPNALGNGITAEQLIADVKDGLAAFGSTHDDFWNQTSTLPVSETNPTIPGLFNHLGELTAVTCEVETVPPVKFRRNRTEHYDPLMRWSITPLDLSDVKTTGYIYMRHLPAGTYYLWVYGHGEEDYNRGKFNVWAGVTDYGEQQTDNDNQWKAAQYAQGKQYVKYGPITVGVAGEIKISVALADHAGTGDDEGWINGLQLYRKT